MFCLSKPKKYSSQTSKQIKLLTDSHGRHIRNLLSNRLDSESCNISCCIKPNGTVHNVLDKVGNYFKDLTRKDYFTIAAGTNDVNLYTDNIMYIASHIEDKVKEFIITNVIIVTALPYRYDEPLLYDKIKRVNRYIERFCQKYNHMYYLSLNTINGYDYAKYGFHFNTNGK